jgi:ketosteroid isomerase-like protein
MKNKTVALCMIVALSATCLAQQKTNTPALDSLVGSERAFANSSVKTGARPSFMMYFADDAVVFRPHPVNYKEAIKNVPMPKNPLETTLAWEPVWGDVSRSGDLGYTTGPSVWTDHSPAKRPTYYGFYFSFWKKQPTGEWKVVFDVGTELPGPFEGSRTFRSPQAGGERGETTTLSADQAGREIQKAEIEFCSAVQSTGCLKAIDGFLDKQARVYRQKLQPIIGIDSARSYFSSNPYLSSWESTNYDVASSGDLGYTYGSYVVRDVSGQSSKDEKGYYLHGWKRDAANRWKLVAEITSPLPPEAPKPKQ